MRPPLTPTVIALALVALALHAPALAVDRPPNVVLILSDDHAWGDYGFMGHDVVQTPHLDRLASQSLCFTRGYVPTSLCRSSLATIVTGLYTHQHGITANNPPDPSQWDAMIALVDRPAKLPQLLGEAGYVSFQSGKWWEGAHARGGFTEGMTHGDRRRGGRHGDAGLAIGRDTMKPVLDFIDRSADSGKPFLLWFAPMLPHTPHNPPRELLDRYKSPDRFIELARYYAMIELFDQRCGELLDHLDKRKLADNTIVVYLADNGWAPATPTRPRLDPHYPTGVRSKHSPYEDGIRTPILIRWPGRITPRRDEKTLAGSIDLMPTVLAACGVKPPPNLPGVNLLDAEALARRDTLYGAIFTHDAPDLANPGAGVLSRWCIHDRWKLIVPSPATMPDAKVELYDLEADPRETTDLAAKDPARVADLRRTLDAWWTPKPSNP